MTTARRVLMIHPGGGWGGGSIALLKVAEALRKSGEFEPFVVFTAEGLAPKHAREMGLPVFVQPVAGIGCVLQSQSTSPLVLMRFLVELIPSMIGLDKLLQTLKIDIVYINTSTVVSAGWIARFRQIPVAWHVREVINTKTLAGRFVTLCVKRFAHTIIANSNCSAAVLTGGKQVKRVYDGVALVGPYMESQLALIRQQWGFDPHALVVGMISPLLWFKGQLVFLNAVPIILSRIPEARFVIVGGAAIPDSYWRTFRGRLRRVLGQDDFMQILRRFVQEHSLERYVYIEGWQQDPALITSAFDVVVFPSLIPEGFGRPQVEAGAAGKPIVASEIGPATELVENGATGILFLPGNAQALADAVSLLLANTQLREAMGRAGRKRVRTYFSDEVHAANMLSIFRQI